MPFKKILHFFLPLSLLILQMYLAMYGGAKIGQYKNPFILLLVSVAIPLYYFMVVIRGNKEQSPAADTGKGGKLLAALLGFASIAVCYKGLHKVFVMFSPPVKYSDVVPQLEAQYDRFSHGAFPYQPVHFQSYDAYPVYMPMHWLPVGISRAFHVDARWCGILLLAIAVAIYAYYVIKGKQNIAVKIVAILLPSLTLWCYIIPATLFLPVSLETIIAAYYLILVTGLVSRNLVITTIGIILCLLSRYTFVFWLPLFFILLWQNRSAKANLIFYSSIFFSVMVFYVIPFLFKDPTILSRGLKYHNLAAVNEWIGDGGNPPISWTFVSGINFARLMQHIFTGDMEHRVFLARVVQALSMIGLLITGLLGYYRFRAKIGFYDFSLVMLYLFILFFYMFGPLTYLYYFMVVLIISSVLCGRIMILATAGKKRNTEDVNPVV